MNYPKILQSLEDIYNWIRKQINKMPSFVSHNEGDLIISLILNLIKDVRKVIVGKNFILSDDELYNRLIDLETIIDLCITNEWLLLKGPNNVLDSRNKLKDLIKELT